jgi:hypothetical protein
MSRGRLVPVGVLVCILAACRQAPTEQQKPPAGAPTHSAAQTVVRVIGHGVDGGDAGICEDFRLTDAQAQEFFSKAVPVTAEQIHDDYEVLPCWVQGTTEKGTEKTTWKIRAGGTADITDSKGDVTYLGCKTCDHILH